MTELKYLNKIPMRNILNIVLILFVCQASFGQEVVTGTATNVYDGDTFTLIAINGEKVKIRVVGIDAPEVDQDYGRESRDYARSLIDSKIVTVYLEPGETYGRKLGIVITSDGKHFNYEMVKAGYAWHYSYYNNDKYLAAAEESARDLKSGLWAEESPQAPWEWRRKR